MTGRERIEAAFSSHGAREIPAVICYEGIFIRDHWAQLTSYPWWYREAPDLERQVRWRRQVVDEMGQDWFRLPFFYSRQERRRLSIQVRPEEVFRVDRRTGREERLTEPQIGGWSPMGGPASVHPDRMATTPEEIDGLIPLPSALDRDRLRTSGRGDLAAQMLEVRYARAQGVFEALRRLTGSWAVSS